MAAILTVKTTILGLTSRSWITFWFGSMEIGSDFPKPISSPSLFKGATMELKIVYTMTFVSEFGACLARKQWRRFQSFPHVFKGLKIAWNAFDEVALDDIHYDPRLYNYWAEFEIDTIIRPGEDLEAVMEMHDEAFIHGGWTRCS
jgi:hypothetical protein